MSRSSSPGKAWSPKRCVAAHALGVIVIVLGGLVAACLAFDSPLPLVVFINAMGWIVLDFIRFIIVITRATSPRDKQRLDGSAMLPLIALYARHHGVHEAVSGVPADQLLATLTDHPDDARIVAEYGYSVGRLKNAVI